MHSPWVTIACLLVFFCLVQFCVPSTQHRAWHTERGGRAGWLAGDGGLSRDHPAHLPTLVPHQILPLSPMGKPTSKITWLRYQVRPPNLGPVRPSVPTSEPLPNLESLSWSCQGFNRLRAHLHLHSSLPCTHHCSYGWVCLGWRPGTCPGL